MPRIIRTGMIEIDSLKPNSYQWVTARVQTLDVDDQGNVLSTSGREGRITRRIDKVATETVTFIDPLTQTPITLSVAALGAGVSACMAKWMTEDYDAHIDPDLGSVVLNGTSI